MHKRYIRSVYPENRLTVYLLYNAILPAHEAHNLKKKDKVIKADA